MSTHIMSVPKKRGCGMSRIEIKLESYLKEHNCSKNSVCKACMMQRTQLNNYCKNKISRVDLTIMARLCEFLDCDISDLLEFKRDEEKGED
ncbi:MAG: helix-turn-helix transcriptional regulator [Enterocloster asparagiformis]|nr:helix-turn-helix transcriptional regulator [Enterocloster asparagiformis]